MPRYIGVVATLANYSTLFFLHQHVTIDAAELTECSTTLSTHLSPLCTTLLEQVRQATSIVAELNQSAESPAAGAKTWTSWLPRSTGASSS